MGRNHNHDFYDAVTRAGDERNQALLAWYRANGRQLPWRSTRDPYPILVSEIMSQQTQIGRVVERFEQFISRWPTVDALAIATNDEVLREWVGLGYNARALRLRDAAIEITKRGWPTTPTELRKLPGVGPYTAHAVASMAFGHTVAAVDTNLRRVISRWVGEPLEGSHLESSAQSLVASDAGTWNQAVMDLGATHCRPTNPVCGSCPVSAFCADPEVYSAPPKQARFEGSQRQLRGALVRAHLAGEDLHEAGTALGRSVEEVREVSARLSEEGLIPTPAIKDPGSGI